MEPPTPRREGERRDLQGCNGAVAVRQTGLGAGGPAIVGGAMAWTMTGRAPNPGRHAPVPFSEAGGKIHISRMHADSRLGECSVLQGLDGCLSAKMRLERCSSPPANVLLCRPLQRPCDIDNLARSRKKLPLVSGIARRSDKATASVA